MIGLYKTECVRHDGPFRSVDDLELATLSWVHWFNTARLHSSLDYSTPIEYETKYYRQNDPRQQPRENPTSATVNSSQPTVNLGGSSRLTVDNSSANHALLKFNVIDTSGYSISSAKLQLTVGSNTDDKSVYGGDVYGVASNSWTESSVNWNTAPAAAGNKVGSVTTAVALNTSYEFDVKPLITGNGTVSMMVKSTSTDGARYYSKEGGTAVQDPQLTVTCGGGGGGDTQAPSQPGNLSGTAVSSSRVDLSWNASTDNVGVTGYRVYRNGSSTPLASLGGSTTSYSDTTVATSTTYTYQVSAVDAAGNESSNANASVTTPGSGGTLTFSPTDDATVDSSQSTVNFGGSSRVIVDNSPANNALLKFDVTGTSGCTISSAKLRLTVGSNTDDKSVYGGDVYGVASNSWSESSVNWNTAPAAGTKVGSVTTAVALNTSYEFDVKTADHRERHRQHDGQDHQQRRCPLLLQRRRHRSPRPTAPGNLRLTAGLLPPDQDRLWRYLMQVRPCRPGSGPTEGPRAAAGPRSRSSVVIDGCDTPT